MLQRVLADHDVGRMRARYKRSRTRAAPVRRTSPSDGPGTPPTAVVTARRRDLQGLRAVAVLLVALNHAGVPFLPGGYVGVDVFFVLSGYFITGRLLRDGFGSDSDALGRISIARFYARRARRILPAACLTLVATSLAVYVVYDRMGHDFLSTKPVLEDALSASLFFVNIHFAATATNYFANATTTMPSPLQHFWSLSVEEQFYVVWPSLLALTFFLCRRRRRGVERQRRSATWLVGLVILVGCAASLAWSIHDSAANPHAAYFSTPDRVWEFGCGAALALLAARPHPPLRIPSALLGWVGMGMIVAAAVLYSGQSAFPGDEALLPDVGASLIILAGMSSARVGVDRPLATRPMAYIGDRSYAFYLWHYPVLVLTWQAMGHVPSLGVNLALLAGAFALSALTYACFENPLRFARWLRGWRTAIMAPVAMSASVLAALVPIAVFDSSLATEAAQAKRAPVATLQPARGQPDPTNLWGSKPIPAVTASANAARRHAPLPNDIQPSMRELEHENSRISYDVPNGCQPTFGKGTTSRICKLGDKSSKRVVAVFGDSHSGMWMPGLEAVARAQKFAVVPLDKAGCLLNDVHINRTGWPCETWYRWALRQDHKLHPVATIVSFELTTQLQAQRNATTGELRSVLGQVSHGVLLTDPPGQTRQPSQCIASHGATMGTCSTKLPSTYVPLMHSIASMVKRTHHPAIPTLQWFCAHGRCPMIIDHTLTTRDRSHFTMEWSGRLAPVLGPELKSILARSG